MLLLATALTILLSMSVTVAKWKVCHAPVTSHSGLSLAYFHTYAMVMSPSKTLIEVDPTSAAFPGSGSSPSNGFGFLIENHHIPGHVCLDPTDHLSS